MGNLGKRTGSGSRGEKSAPSGRRKGSGGHKVFSTGGEAQTLWGRRWNPGPWGDLSFLTLRRARQPAGEPRRCRRAGWSLCSEEPSHPAAELSPSTQKAAPTRATAEG